MATRGRGRASVGNISKTSEQLPSGRKAKSPKSIKELSDYLQTLSVDNISHYGQMFADMVLDFISISTSQDNMTSTIELIFTTTVESREYTSLGAKVCQKIVMSLPSDSDQKKAQRNLFRKTLLGRFQSEYGNREMTRKVSIESWLAIFSFLCEIFNCIQVNDKPLAVIGKAILSGMEWILSLKDIIDDEIECICEKLKVLGKTLEAISRDKVLSVFCLLRTKIISQSTSCRSRCIILELIEFRAMGWIDKDNELDTFYMDAVADATAEDDLS